MSCPALSTGSQFLSGVMAHIDCQARGIGAYGYGALADPGSGAFAVLSSILAVFIALHGIRLLFDGNDYERRLITDMIKVGIVLTIATSWPAWRIIGYDLVLDGPLEVAQTVGLASGVSSTARYDQLQALDDTLVVMTAYGTGRLSGSGVSKGSEPGDSFQGVALADQFALGWGRGGFLIGAIAPFGITRLSAGLLLALAPLLAGLYLFSGTAGLFLGWIRSLAFCALGSFTQYMLQAIEVGLITPWARDVVAGREGGILTPSAPTELLVISLSFTFINLGVLAVFVRMAFHTGGTNPPMLRYVAAAVASVRQERLPPSNRMSIISASRSRGIAEAVSRPTRDVAISNRQLIGNPIMSNLRENSARSSSNQSSATGNRATVSMGGARTTRRTLASTQRRDGR